MLCGVTRGLRGGQRRGVSGDARRRRRRCRVHGFRHAGAGRGADDRAGAGAASRPQNHHALDVRRGELLFAHGRSRSAGLFAEGFRHRRRDRGCRDGGGGRQLFFAAAAFVAHGTHAHAGRRRGRTAVVART